MAVLVNREEPLASTNAPGPWQTVPRRTIVIFVLAVFFVFLGVGFANDVIDMGRQPTLRFAVSVFLTGLLSVLYAYTGVRLGRKSWIAFFPLFVLQFLFMWLFANWLPDAPMPAQLNAGQTDHLHIRLIFDGIAIITSVALGYAGFAHVSVSEAKRHVKLQLEKASLDSEMAAAREIQRVMVPEDVPPVAGYAIESVYRPAAEVGGDFFQMIPLNSGRTLVVIGDVSGKGLRAAMIVSMIVGILCAESEHTEEPSEILTELNRRLCGRTHGGFATCLVVRLEPGPGIALANAGHPSPYLNGVDVKMTGSMPLGVVADATYEQTGMEMRAGDRVVLITDGVPEAQNEARELLGFGRVESLMREGASVRDVAEAAERHGQQDDITVISIVRER
jgi:serine phosphatase RsbU (regulator of sigma subunit)